MFKKNDWIILTDPNKFLSMDDRNSNVFEQFDAVPLQIIQMNSNGAVEKFKNKSGYVFQFTVTANELKNCFSTYTDHGNFKIIITYIEEGKTIEEEGVYYINVTDKSFEYHFNRKRMGFLKYKGEVSVELDELKQITLSTPVHERVLHIEKGVIVREHIMYDNERKFTNIRYGD